MNWSVAVNALSSPQPHLVAWPDDRRRVVHLLGSLPPAKPKPPRPAAATRSTAAVALTDVALIEALKAGRVTGPVSIALHFGVSRSSGHRHLARLVAAGRLQRVAWGHWRVLR